MLGKLYWDINVNYCHSRVKSDSNRIPLLLEESSWDLPSLTCLLNGGGHKPTDEQLSISQESVIDPRTECEGQDGALFAPLYSFIL